MKLSLGISCLAAVADAWTYSECAVVDACATAWQTEAPLCAAVTPNQSPIDILTADPLEVTNPLVFQGLPDSATTPEIKAEIEINGHTWEVAWDIDDAATEKYGVQYNGKIFKLMQFHFHSPSEHTVDGKHYDLEAHMVHACYGGSENVSCTTDEPGDENLVVAIFMNVGDENPFLASVWPQLGTLASNESAPFIIAEVANPYNALVPPQPHDFYRYMGSTTTPTCVQNVEWFLMTTPTTLSQAQLTSYRTAITAHANTQTLTVATIPEGVTEGWDVTKGINNRPIQGMGDRVIEKYTQPEEVAQQQRSFMWHGLLIGVCVVAAGICCLVAFMFAGKPKEKKPASKRAIKPVKKTPPEQTPLVPPPAPPAPVPMLFTQPLQVPVTTFASPVQQMQVQQGFAPQGFAPQGFAPQGFAPQVRMVAP